MSESFQWNPHSDQPHNIAPKKKRINYYFKHADSYIDIFSANLNKAVPALSLYRRYKKKMYNETVKIVKPFAISVSQQEEKNTEIADSLREIGVCQTLVRIPSWERDKLQSFEKFFDILQKKEIEFSVALLQQRDDVLHPSHWEHFLEDVFSSFGGKCSFFEIGHAWNRSKWGVWDHKEYLKLARPAFFLAKYYGVKLVGPAVIDFEFHLYAPVLKEIPFDKVSSLLYVDRMGAPENKQFGWNTPRKIALLKAIIDACLKKKQCLWITEVNWPLQGTGKYSPASGKPNVSEEQQADYLVRYFILALASGYIERIYWWQLAAPGYGLIDCREKTWRKRPSFFAMKTLVSFLEGSTFTGKIHQPGVELFSFSKGKKNFTICWSNRGHLPFYEYCFPKKVIEVVGRDGKEISFKDNKIKITESPIYVFSEDSS
ncbi:MAG: hypothetical protein U9Q97_06100 [Acidobacteriota bacterium]|nr:hypothetical protein [Acidobacteriota bacterium]